LNKKQGIFIFVLIFGFIMHLGYSETLFRVSGKVLRKGKGVKGVIIVCNGRNINSGKVLHKEVMTDSEGKYIIELPKGEYSFYVKAVLWKGRDTLDDVNIYSLRIEDKNIKNFNFYLYTEEEIIKMNRDILDSVPKNKPFVEYEWGRIPLHTEKECREFVRNRLKEDKKMLSELTGIRINGLTISKGIPLYDLRGNPISYIYFVKKNGVEIARYEVLAIGNNIENTTRSKPLVDKEEYERLVKKGEKTHSLKEEIDNAIKYYVKKHKIKVNDIKILKLISGIYLFRNQMYYSPKILIKNKKENKINILEIEDRECWADDWSFEETRNFYERETTLGYILHNLRNAK